MRFFSGLLREAIGVLLSILLFLDFQNSERFFREREKGEEPSITLPDFMTWHLLFSRIAERPGFSPPPLVHTHLLTCLLHSILGHGDFMG